MDVEITHKDATGKEVSDGTLTASSTSDGWPNADFSKLVADSPKQYPNWPAGIVSQNMIVKKISVGKVKEGYKEVENVLVVKIKIHNDIPDNVTTATLMPFSILRTEDRIYAGTMTVFQATEKIPDLKTYLTTTAASGKKITDRNWGFDYISMD